MDFNTASIISIAEQAVIKKDKNILIEAINHLSIRAYGYDSSDIITELAIIHHTANKLGEDPDRFLLNNSENCTSKLKEHIRKFLKRIPEDKTIEAMGYGETNSPEFKYIFTL